MIGGSVNDWLKAIAAVAMCVGVLSACGKSEEVSVTESPAQAVKATRLNAVTWPQTIAANGMIHPQNIVNISAETGGLRIAALHVDVGQTVKKGQLLAKLATDTLQVDLARQQGLLAQAEAGLAQAKANAARTRALAASGAMSDEAILQYQVAEQTAQAQLKVAKADVAATELKIKQAEIRAWESGVIAARPAQLGQVVNLGTPLFEIYQGGVLEWRAEVTAAQAARVAIGQTAELMIAGGKAIDATIVKIETALDNSTGRLTVYAELPIDSSARAGMFASGRILTGETQAISIEEAALLLRDGRNYLLQIDAEQKLVRRTVETGRRQAGRVEILTPLDPDSQFVAEGAAFLSEGITVKVVESAP